MGVGKRAIGILCGLLLCIMIAVVLSKGKQEEVSKRGKAPESLVMEESALPVPIVTEIPTSTVTQATEEIEETMEKETAEAEKNTPLPISVSTSLPATKPTAIPVPVIKETAIPQPAITNPPVPVVTATPIPVITHTPGPTEIPIPTPETTEREEKHVHQFEKSVWELPTCEKGGYYNNVCKECGVVECVTQEPIPHEVEDIVIQEGNCMEDRVIRHICKMCEQIVESDTRYTVYDKHSWIMEQVDGEELEYCTWCGVTK